MRNLMIVAWPGDETTRFAHAVFAGGAWDAILVCADPQGTESAADAEEAWRCACRDLGIVPRASLRAPFLAGGAYDLARLVAQLEPHVRGYADVYAASFNDGQMLRQVVTRAAAMLLDELLIETTNAEAATMCALPAGALAKLFDVVNRHYGLRLRTGRITAGDFRPARQYVRVRSRDVRHFADVHMEYYNAQLDDDNPYDFETSEYERLRFELELEVLHLVDWHTLIEMGACIGTFTARLLDAFPGRRIIAYEPAGQSFARLQTRAGGRAELRRESAADVRETCDLLLLSSVVYYLRPIPLSLFDASTRWLVASHGRWDHEVLLDPILRSTGWRRVVTRELLPRIELYSGVPLVKAGSEVVVWERA